MSAGFSVLIFTRGWGYSFKIGSARSPTNFFTQREALEEAWDTLQIVLDCPETGLREIVERSVDPL